MSFQFTKPLVANILQDNRREWTVQGFGFLRTYFGSADNPKQYRLNLWDRRFTVPGVSTIHDHPWEFTSLIIAGGFSNQRYRMSWCSPKDIFPNPTHAFTNLKTVEGGGLVKGDFGACVLERRQRENYLPGETYHQHAQEIHETLFDDGAVTLNERIGDTQHARVFWPWGTHWVDACPRPATPEEVSSAVLNSLRRWF